MGARVDDVLVILLISSFCGGSLDSFFPLREAMTFGYDEAGRQ